MLKQLLISEAYKAYRALARAPFGAEPFEPNENDFIEIHLGEVYCRVKVGDELCGNALQSRGALVNHVKKHHTDIKVLASESTGNPSMAKISAARIWYSAVMKTHNEIASKKASQHDPNVPEPPLTPVVAARRLLSLFRSRSQQVLNDLRSLPSRRQTRRRVKLLAMLTTAGQPV
ncbi:hypothetical protein BU23DRAFT_191450 [Bimuria novae-zelandiae CBS 107.79]|uniref:Uncharacterized protein n=1 Tax=Bimuria novae-zelandiae CBS 107.79 TaxID=1447943 RepID=A0A6A5VNP3_9PLEO|nr:hypothetical protein BU23DRAFT_191450 [Bimuria novae-zelandiae CBS 107.79]